LGRHGWVKQNFKIFASRKFTEILRSFARFWGKHPASFTFKQTVKLNFFKFFKQELAVDLGTANTLIMVEDQVVVDEPSIVAMNRRTGETIAVGHRAMQMHEKTHENIKTVRPLKDGVIADFQAAEAMIESMIKMVGRKNSFFSHLKMVICIPSGITEVEKRAVFDSADHVDSKETYLIHEPMAAALGIGLNIEEPVGNMIIDIGGGTSEIAVIALGGIVNSRSIRIAGDEFNSDIEEYMRRQHNILVGERTAETIKIEVGSAMTELDNPPPDFAVRSRDLMTGIPKEITVTYSEIAQALDKSISKIEEAILSALESESTASALASRMDKKGLDAVAKAFFARRPDLGLRELGRLSPAAAR